MPLTPNSARPTIDFNTNQELFPGSGLATIMNTQRPSARPLAFLVLMLAAAALAAGCKPGLLKQAEKLAGQIKRETGTPQKLRSWFNEVQSEPNTAKPKQLAIPASLGSVWASGTTAYPAW